MKRQIEKLKKRFYQTDLSLKYSGLIAAIFTSVQAIVWTLLSTTAILCFFAHNCNKTSLGVIFSNQYFDRSAQRIINTVITPIAFHVIMWMYLIISIIWLIAGLHLIVVFYAWKDPVKIKKAPKPWIYITLIICAVDIITFILFTVDFHLVVNPAEGSLSAIEQRAALEDKIQLRAIQGYPREEQERFKPRRKKPSDEIDNPFVEPKYPINAADLNDTLDALDLLRMNHVPNYATSRTPTGSGWEQVGAGADTLSGSPATPIAIMMTLAIRGYITWIVNLVSAIRVLIIRKRKNTGDTDQKSSNKKDNKKDKDKPLLSFFSRKK